LQPTFNSLELVQKNKPQGSFLRLRPKGIGTRIPSGGAYDASKLTAATGQFDQPVAKTNNLTQKQQMRPSRSQTG
jgi:hypothetical protein